MFVKRFW